MLENLNMAQQLEIKMARFENSPWGFRLHGGADFATPLTIQKVRHFNNLFITRIILLVWHNRSVKISIIEGNKIYVRD